MTQTLEMPPRSRSLLAISDEQSRLRDELEALEGDITGEAGQTLLDEYLSAGVELERKLDNCAAVVAELEASAKARRERTGELIELAKADENRAAQIKERMLLAMQENNLTRVNSARHRITRAQNGGLQPIKVLCEAEELPEEFQKISVSADTKKLRDALLHASDSCPFAVLEERGEHVRIS